MTGKYVAGEGSGDEAAKGFVSLNWVLTEEPLDVETELALGFLDYLLLGTSASPLRKALNDSGLGEAIIGGGLMDELRQPIFSLGLKGVIPTDSQKVSRLEVWCRTRQWVLLWLIGVEVLCVNLVSTVPSFLVRWRSSFWASWRNVPGRASATRQSKPLSTQSNSVCAKTTPALSRAA